MNKSKQRHLTHYEKGFTQYCGRILNLIFIKLLHVLQNFTALFKLRNKSIQPIQLLRK